VVVLVKRLNTHTHTKHQLLTVEYSCSHYIQSYMPLPQLSTHASLSWCSVTWYWQSVTVDTVDTRKHLQPTARFTAKWFTATGISYSSDARNAYELKRL